MVDNRPDEAALAKAYEGLEAVYGEVDRRVAGAGWTCRACGGCCDFASKGFELWGSVLEAAWMRACGPEVGSLEEGVCPYRGEHGTCGNRRGRVLGCRVYFCDAAEQGMSELYEWALGAIRGLHEGAGLAWRYGAVLKLLSSSEVKEVCQGGKGVFSA